LLEAEIRIKGKSPRIYKKLAQKLDYASLVHLSNLAIKYENLSALVNLADINPLAVADALSASEGVQLVRQKISENSTRVPELYFLLRGNLSAKYRTVFRRLARVSILKASLRLSGRGIRGEIIKRVKYAPWMADFDMEETLENYLEKRYLTYDDIVGLDRKESRKTGVLMLDTSGSMSDKKIINAALVTAVTAYHMRNDDYGVILFNTRGTVLKPIDKKASTLGLIDSILDSEVAGSTNISDALRKGCYELSKVKTKKKWGILITDGIHNYGEPPQDFAASFPILHVIGLPTKESIGRRTCEKLSKLGGGRYYQLQRYSDIPRILNRILKKT